MNVEAVVEAEKLVVGSVFLKPELLRVALDYEVNDLWFSSPDIRLIWRIMEDMSSRGEMIDAVSVATHLPSKDDNAFRLAMIEIPAKTITPVLFAQHLDIVRRAYASRSMVEDASEFAKRAADSNGNIPELCSQYGTKLRYMQGLLEDYTASDLPTWRTEAVETVNELLAKPFAKRKSFWGDGLLDERSRMIVSGRAKIGKSQFVSELGLRIANGKPFLGFDTQQACVLYLQQEISPVRLQDRFAKLTKEEDNPPTEAFRIVTCDGMRITLPAHQDWLKEKINEHKVKIVILDPLYKFHTCEENSATEMKGILNVLDAFIAEYAITWILVHHHKKETKDEIKGPQQIRGTSALHDWLDSALIMNEHEEENKIYLQWSVRNAEDPGKMILYREPDTLSWRKIINLDSAGARFGFEDLKPVILGLAKQQYGQWVKQKDICNKAKETVGCPKSQDKIRGILNEYAQEHPEELKKQTGNQANEVFWAVFPPKADPQYTIDPDVMEG